MGTAEILEQEQLSEAMLDRIIQFSLDNRVLVVAGAVLLLVYGGIVVNQLPVDVFPDLNRPTVTIFLEAEGSPAPGASRVFPPSRSSNAAPHNSSSDRNSPPPSSAATAVFTSPSPARASTSGPAR